MTDFIYRFSEHERELQRRLKKGLTWKGKPIMVEEQGKKAEFIDHPEHYGGKDNPYEIIKVLENIMTYEEFIGFCKGNAIKYMARGKSKYGGMEENQDYKKSEWYTNYMNDFIKRKAVK